VETRETHIAGPDQQRPPDALSRIAKQAVGNLSCAIGRIEPWREQNRWADLIDSFGNRMGRVSVHTIPNGHTARVDIFLHALPPYLAGVMEQPLALRDAGGSAVRGEWQGITSCCRFTVPRDRSVTLEVSVPEPVPAKDDARVIEHARHEELERIQECLDGSRARKGKRHP